MLGSFSRPGSSLKRRDGSQSKRGSIISAPSLSETKCRLCAKNFNTFRHKYNCKNCNHAVCGDCSKNRIKMSNRQEKTSRACNACFVELSQAQSCKVSKEPQDQAFQRGQATTRLVQALAALQELRLSGVQVNELVQDLQRNDKAVRFMQALVPKLEGTTGFQRKQNTQGDTLLMGGSLANDDETPQQEEELEPILWQGWLMKTGGRFRSWKRRWLVLEREPRGLSWYKDDTLSTKLGTMPLPANARIAESSGGAKGFKFTVHTPNRDLELSASSEEDRVDCITALDKLLAPPQEEDVARAGVDPREQIYDYFCPGNDTGPKGFVDQFAGMHNEESSQFFTVWRPTSDDAIGLMMQNKAVGKGLNIKGKSAKCGILSGFVPFVQISDDEHKKRVSMRAYKARTRIFYKTRKLRQAALKQFITVLKMMKKGLEETLLAVANMDMSQSPVSNDSLRRLTTWKMELPAVRLIEDTTNAYGRPTVFGLEVPERLLWETYIERQEMDPNFYPLPPGEDDSDGKGWQTGRPSEPAFMDLNMYACRHYNPTLDSARVVVFQYDSGNAMNPRGLLMAYQDSSGVLPVASDFDCFLVGSKGVLHTSPVPEVQIDVSDWCLKNIEKVLRTPKPDSSWTRRWLEVMKFEAMTRGFHPEFPKFGFGDPNSYEIIAGLATKLASSSGAVRHGAECFNFYFPQELDQQYLVIWNGWGAGDEKENSEEKKDTVEEGDGEETKGEHTENHASARYRYLTEPEMRAFLLDRVRDGFSFPMNLKWVLCDPGYWDIYQALCEQKGGFSINKDAWYPEHDGKFELLQKVQRLHDEYPNGFVSTSGEEVDADVAQYELRRAVILHRAKAKLRSVLMWMRIHRASKKRVQKAALEAKAKEGEKEREGEKEEEGEQQKEAEPPTTRVRGSNAGTSGMATVEEVTEQE